MWVCKRCETENWDNSTTCSCCGMVKSEGSEEKEQSPPPPSPKRCPHCSAELSSSTNFCPNCGKKLTAGGAYRTRTIGLLVMTILVFVSLILIGNSNDSSQNSNVRTTTATSSVSTAKPSTYSSTATAKPSTYTYTYTPSPTNTPSYSSSSSSSSTTNTYSKSPSDADLTASGVTANIRYPKDKYYLSEYKYGQINAPKGNSVYGFKYSRPSDGTTIVCYPKHGESVTVLAIQYGRACVILDSTQEACWVNEDYIKYY